MSSEQQFVPRELPREAVLDALAAGSVVATGNARLARSLTAEFERRKLASGATAWPTPAVLPLPSWLLTVYEEASLRSPDPLPRVLDQAQEEQLWAAVIRDAHAERWGEDRSEEPAAPLRVAATACRARQSWQLVREFQLNPADRRFGLNENPEAFRRWAQRFAARTRERGEIPAADLPARIVPLLAEGLCPLPPRLLLIGFYALTPAQQALVAALRAAGCDADWLELRAEPGAAMRVRADDPRHELVQAASWARGLLGQQPRLRLGIVVPDLGARRAALAQHLRRALDPASLLPGAAPAPRPWNISLGRPLIGYPVVATALRLLGLMRPPADTETLGLLLLSPHWALPGDLAERRAELERRAMLDRRIRRLGDARMTLATLRFHAAGGGDDQPARPWHSTQLAARLDALLALSRALPGRGDAGVWAETFSAWLEAADWGAYGRGGRPLDSHEYQAVEAWNDLLSRLNSLSDYAGTLGLEDAQALLGRLAAETLFQPRAGDASVQVLGLYEAIGQSFDKLWVMGLHDGVWPPTPGPDPFLPIGLQREHRLPHSGPEVELEWAASVTAQLQRSAAEVVFSYPTRDGGEALHCSPLIAALPERDPQDLLQGDVPDWQRQVAESAVPDAVPSCAAVPLRQSLVAGGSRVFADQAACPFRAFANHRLGAAPLERPQAGLDAMRRGTLTHRLLARLWADLRTHANLLALDEAALRARLRTHIEELLEAERRRSPVTFTARFRAVEAQRLEERVTRWLALERDRSPFTVVAQEEERRFTTGGISVRLFIDRIDRLEDGARVVLDYKTGAVRPSAWFGARPEEPQLPLYGVAVDGGVPASPGADASMADPSTADASTADGATAEDSEVSAAGSAPVAAIAFAQIRADGVGFTGVVREPGLLPGLPGNRKGPLREATDGWPAVLADWAAELERLAGQFRAGVAAVDPKRGLRTCESTFCELQPLCRVRERLALTGTAEGGADDEETGDEARSGD